MLRAAPASRTFQEYCKWLDTLPGTDWSLTRCRSALRPYQNPGSQKLGIEKPVLLFDMMVSGAISISLPFHAAGSDTGH